MENLNQTRIVFRSFVDQLLNTPRGALDADAVVEKHLPDFVAAILDRQLLEPSQIEHFIPALDARRLRNMRYTKKGPPFAKIGASVYYRIPDILSWVDQHMVHHR